MKPLYTTALVAFFMMFVSVGAKAQDYAHAIKLKGFLPMGVSYKYLNGFEKGYEAVYQNLDHGHSLTALRIMQTPAFPKLSDKWFVCYGYGAHVSLYTQHRRRNPFRMFAPPYVSHRTFVSTGLDGYVGIEYRVLKHPFVISADFIPNFEFFGPDFFRVNVGSTTVGLAYVF